MISPDCCSCCSLQLSSHCLALFNPSEWRVHSSSAAPALSVCPAPPAQSRDREPAVPQERQTEVLPSEVPRGLPGRDCAAAAAATLAAQGAELKVSRANQTARRRALVYVLDEETMIMNLFCTTSKSGSMGVRLNS